jgi:hypothetical protein
MSLVHWILMMLNKGSPVLCRGFSTLLSIHAIPPSPITNYTIVLTVQKMHAQRVIDETYLTLVIIDVRDFNK